MAPAVIVTSQDGRKSGVEVGLDIVVFGKWNGRLQEDVEIVGDGREKARIAELINNRIRSDGSNPVSAAAGRRAAIETDQRIAGGQFR